LHSSDVDREDLGAIVGEKSGERAANDFAAVDYCYRTAVETVAVWEDGVVRSEMF